MALIENEKQITVDPMSVLYLSPPHLLPAKPKFLSYNSLPNSANSSPRFGSKKKWKNDGQVSSHQPMGQDSRLQRSKSCGEERHTRPSTDEFDLIFDDNAPSMAHENIHFDHNSRKNNIDPIDERFKCGALCLFLPGFGKGKVVRPRKEEITEIENVISRTVSLEKFECGSWASSGIINDSEGGESGNLYFDLPLELIQSSLNDAVSPVAAAFVFDKERKGVLKNVNTKATTNARKSHESSRHVRFSTSSPKSHPVSPTSCITPRLRKARDEFNAFLEATSA